LETLDRSTIAGAEYSIGRDLHEGRINHAIRTAAKLNGQDPSTVEYNSVEKAGAAYTKPYGTLGFFKVSVLDDGLGNRRGGALAARVLLSTVMHESVHVRQLQAGTWTNQGKGYAVNELEAYDTELRMASRLGLPDSEVRSVAKYRAEYFEEVKGIPEYVRNLGQGIYAPIKGLR
jgi:hypothetical protein